VRLSTFVVSAFMLILPITGCLTPEDNRIVVEEPTIFDFLNPIPKTTWFHYSGAVDALDSESIESANLTLALLAPRRRYKSNEKDKIIQRCKTCFWP